MHALLHCVLTAEPNRVGIGKKSELHKTLDTFIPLLEVSYSHPSHISKLVSPSLPHYYGYVDATTGGIGGVWLPCTRWLQPVVWCIQWPDNIAAQVCLPAGMVTNNDVEAAAVFIAKCFLDNFVEGNTAGITSHLGSDNSSTVSWNQCDACHGKHQCPKCLLR